MKRTNRRPVIALLPAIAIALAACGVPSGADTFEPIPDEDVLFDLAEPSTTTTTTTTTTLPPPVDPTTTSTTAPVPTIASEPVMLYFISRDELVEVPAPAPFGFSVNELLDLLEAGPDPDRVPPLDTEIDSGLVDSIDVQRGQATLDLDRVIFGRIREDDRERAFGQIVLTLTKNVAGVGQVLFTLDGEQFLAPIGNNRFRITTSRDDYAGLVAGAIVVEPPPTTTTTVSESGGTSEPVESSPATLEP